MRTNLLLCLILALVVGACFDVPVLPPRDVGARDARLRDAHTPVPLEVREVRVVDVRGMRWPLEAAPRRLALEIELTAPIVEDEEAIVLVRGEPGDSLREDVARRPLTIATRQRIVDSDVVHDGPLVRVTPRDALAPGDIVTLAIASFATSIEDETLERTHLARVHVSTDPSAGARVIGTFPGDGTLDVPTNAEPFLLALDGDVTWTGDPMAVRDQNGAIETVTSTTECGAVGLAGHVCVSTAPRGPWPSGARLVIETTAALRDATSASVPSHRIEVTTAVGPDTRAPTFLGMPERCPIDADADTSRGCSIVTDESWALELVVDEPVRIVLTRPGVVLRALAPRGTATLMLRDLAPSMREDATLEVFDLAGLRTVEPIVVTTRAPLAPITLTEVCANPIGAEPDQEWIELANVGESPAALEGLRLADREDALGQPLSTSRVLAPGARVLLVGADFDAEAAGVPPGTPLVIAGPTIVPSGITNSGEPLFLRDAALARLAHVPSFAGREGECLVRDDDASARADGIDDFHYDGCTPGR
jgi:hypothetical protein